MKKTFSSFLLLAGLSLSIAFCNNTTQAGTPAADTAEPVVAKESLGTQWTPVSLNKEEETVSAFVVTKKGRLVAGTSAGIMLSDDKGATWKPATINPDDKAAVFSLAMDVSGIIYAGLSRYGVLVSADNGNSWKLHSTGLNKGGPRSSYAMLVSGNNIFKGTYESGLYLSTDKGQSWNPSNNGIPLDLTTGRMVSVTQLVQNNSTLYALTDLGVRYSTDKGKSWNKPAHNGIERLGYMAALAVSNNNLYTGISSSQKGVFLSTDNGNNWKPAGLEGKEVYSLFAAPNGVIYAGTAGEVYRSADNGKTWTAVGAGLPASRHIYSIGLTPDGKLLAGVNRGGTYLLK
jgi:photosystem II stability/assembly factor-like uncharacterized protein